MSELKTKKFSLKDWKKRYASAKTVKEKQKLKKELTLTTEGRSPLPKTERSGFGGG